MVPYNESYECLLRGSDPLATCSTLAGTSEPKCVARNGPFQRDNGGCDWSPLLQAVARGQAACLGETTQGGSPWNAKGKGLMQILVGYRPGTAVVTDGRSARTDCENAPATNRR